MKKTITLFASLLCCFSLLQAQGITWLSNCSDQNFCLNNNSCTQGYVLMVANASTGSCGNQSINFSYKIDLFNNGSTDITVSNDSVSGNFDKGIHKISWKATDNCGNSSNCTYLFTIKDCQPPSMICINGLTQQIEQPTCSEIFLAKSFVLNMNDNCTPANQIQIGIREKGIGTGFPTDTSISFGLCDKGINFVEIFVKDANGLINQCNSYVLVQDSDNDCICNQDADLAMMGCVRTADNKKISNYTLRSNVVSVSGATPPINKSKIKTTADSCFSIGIDKLPFGATYQASLRITYYSDYLNGVSTLDLVQLSKHILNIEPFTSAYQTLAADVNRSNSVTTFDIVEIRKLILGIYDTFPKSPAWHMIRPFANPSNELSFTAVQDTYQLTLPNLNDDYAWSGLNFVGVKSGDVNFSAVTGLQQGTDDRINPLFLRVENKQVQAGQIVEVPIYLTNKTALEGWQMALQCSPEQIEYLDVMGLPAEQVFMDPKGFLRLLDYRTSFKDWDAETPLFTLRLRARQDVSLASVLRLQPTVLRAEGYTPDGKRPFSLHFSGTSTERALLLGPMPNPMQFESAFDLSLTDKSNVRVAIFDVSGRCLQQTDQIMESGLHPIVLERKLFPAAGLYAYRIQVADQWWCGKLFVE